MSSVYPSSILWTRIYLESSDPVRRNAKISEEDRKARETRRRIEDIKEASRLEREALDDVWDQ